MKDKPGAFRLQAPKGGSFSGQVVRTVSVSSSKIYMLLRGKGTASDQHVTAR